MKFKCDGLSAHSLRKSDLVKGLASFDYSVFFLLPREQAASWYGCSSSSFSAKGCVASRLRTLYIEEFMDLVDDLQFSYTDDDGHGPTVGDMVTFLCSCPKLCRKQKTSTMLRLTCLFFGHFPPVLPSVKFGSAVSPSSSSELSEIIEPVNSYLLSCNAENNIFTHPCSINECVDLLYGFTGTLLSNSSAKIVDGTKPGLSFSPSL